MAIAMRRSNYQVEWMAFFKRHGNLRLAIVWSTVGPMESRIAVGFVFLCMWSFCLSLFQVLPLPFSCSDAAKEQNTAKVGKDECNIQMTKHMAAVTRTMGLPLRNSSET